MLRFSMLACLLVTWSGFVVRAGEISWASDHILIRFKPEARALLPADAVPGQLTALQQRLNLPEGAQLQETALARSFRQERKTVSLSLPNQLDLDQFFYLRLPPGLDVAGCLRWLEKHPLLEYAEPDHLGTAANTIPNDPNFADQWHHLNSSQPSASIQTPLAWDITQGSTNVLVAVLDSGLMETAEFAGRTVPGYNFAYTNEVTLDDNGHGTQVAGVLAASANNGVLGAGVDWHCRLMPVKVFNESNLGYHSWWAQGIDYAVANGCKIINLSGASAEFGRTVQRAITNAIAHGVIFVTAAGNLGGTNLGFPGYLREAITVGATDQQDLRAHFSNSGPQLDLVAPGVDIATIGLPGELEYARGTSFSAPMVAGTCALLAAVRPGLTQADAQLLLCAGAEDQVGDAEDTPGFDTHYGWGRLNAYHSLLLATLRIDEVRSAKGRIELSWISPANAGSGQPYQVEYRTVLSSGWIPLTVTNAFRYTPNRTFWTDDGTQTGGLSEARFYRVVLRPL